ncbi:probable E3 ubiquitin-protein ligase rbrA, partial [Arabidopsis lyrata subsp. lyrata]|uniref:probable E3 ubiquitin-protein ligase rbrA n=1 Tax=Arabidopsis lyrata subsp. lyrata TaxID=81972 RepID=UPI000A29E9AE
MDKHDLHSISKKRRINDVVTEDIPNLKGERGSKVVESTFQTTKCADNIVYKLYFKGLVSDETSSDKEMIVKVGFRVAIYDETDNLFHGINKSLNDAVINRKEADILALITGLDESIHCGIKNVVICCDDCQIYQIIIGREKPQQKIVHLLEEVQRLREKLASTGTVVVARDDVNFALRLAIDALVSESSSSSDDGEKTCAICIEETDAEHMFFTDKCLHRHCFSCVNKNVEVKLLSRTVPTCLESGCKSELTLESCSQVLTPKLIEMWKRKMKEDLIPHAEKIYCPYPRCSVLMSKTELSSEAEQSNVRACIKCYGLFCIDCKVPSHSDLSCAEYKRLHPEPPFDDMELKCLANDQMWRQCTECKHMIELSDGCNHITCRCGYEFCYRCGHGWTKYQCPSGCPLMGDDGDEAEYDFDDDNEEDDNDDDEDEAEYDFDNDDEEEDDNDEDEIDFDDY